MSRYIRHTRRKKSPFSKFLAALAIALVAMFVFQNRDIFLPWWFPTGSSQHLPSPVAEKRPDLEQLAPSAGKLAETEKDNLSGISSLSCQEVASRLSEFFRHLDTNDYVLAFELENGSCAYLNEVVLKLRSNPPKQASTLGNREEIIGNFLHFYRALGTDGIVFLKNILVREHADIEQLFGLFYRWTTFTDAECLEAEDVGFHVPLRELAEYASFFSNTAGGQAYLMRRDPTVRFLSLYYSLLVLDRAKNEGLYENHTELEMHLTHLLQEAHFVEGLMYREEYIQKLTALQQKYGKK